MAQVYLGLDKGETKDDVTVGASTTATTDVELRIDLAAAMSEAEIEIAVLNIRARLHEVFDSVRTT